MIKTILVIDDSPFVYKQVKDMVEEKGGYEVIGSAKTGEEGIELYKQLNPDAVILEIIMPGIDGIETAQRILELDPNAKIMMLSSLYDTNMKDEVRAIGLKYLVPKPLEADLLFVTLELLDKK